MRVLGLSACDLETRREGGSLQDDGHILQTHRSDEQDSNHPGSHDGEKRMKLYRWIMRFLARKCEDQRMQFRRELHRVEAHAEDLVRTLGGGN